jgi:hypothetical protein
MTLHGDIQWSFQLLGEAQIGLWSRPAGHKAIPDLKNNQKSWQIGSSGRVLPCKSETNTYGELYSGYEPGRLQCPGGLVVISPQF